MTSSWNDRLADITIAQVEEQVKDGRVTLIQHCDGTKEVRHTKGVDPRMVGEAGRRLIRFAEFAGLMDRAPEVHAAATLISLAAPADGASFDQRWNTPSEPAVDVSATSSSGIPTTAELTPSPPEPAEG